MPLGLRTFTHSQCLYYSCLWPHIDSMTSSWNSSLCGNPVPLCVTIGKSLNCFELGCPSMLNGEIMILNSQARRRVERLHSDCPLLCEGLLPVTAVRHRTSVSRVLGDRTILQPCFYPKCRHTSKMLPRGHQAQGQKSLSGFLISAQGNPI